MSETSETETLLLHVQHLVHYYKHSRTTERQKLRFFSVLDVESFPPKALPQCENVLTAVREAVEGLLHYRTGGVCC